MKRGSRGKILPDLAAPERAVPRRLRVEGQLWEVLSAALAGLEDPRLSLLRITRVQMTDDLQLARIYVHQSAATAETPDGQRAVMRGLRSAGGRLRREVGRALGLRYTPELRFQYDGGVEAAQRVDALLHEIDAERESKPE